ncbi:signal peptidase II [Nocardioides sp.]|uniref:signal peptidase II n=1 Tax=Nocardioides sp. TaxID=35761 RepID=UPI003567EF21
MQTARGTSLSGADSPSTQEPSRITHRAALVVFGGVAVCFYAIDQVTKYLAVANLEGAPDRQLIGEILQLRLTRNPGAAFSAVTSFTEVLTVIAISAVVVVLWLSRRLGSRLWAVGFGLLLAGVAGNLTDRMLRQPGPLRGHVIDFLMLPHWPIFNVADICINGAAAIILIQAFRGVRLNGARVRDEAEA